MEKAYGEELADKKPCGKDLAPILSVTCTNIITPSQYCLDPSRYRYSFNLSLTGIFFFKVVYEYLPLPPSFNDDWSFWIQNKNKTLWSTVWFLTCWTKYNSWTVWNKNYFMQLFEDKVSLSMLLKPKLPKTQNLSVSQT